MREQGQNLTVAKDKVKRLLGVNAIIKINSPRGKTETMKGHVSALFPAVFTITLEDGKKRTLPYADVLTGSVLFLNPNDVQI